MPMNRYNNYLLKLPQNFDNKEMKAFGTKLVRYGWDLDEERVLMNLSVWAKTIPSPHSNHQRHSVEVRVDKNARMV